MKVDMYKISRTILYIGLVMWAVGITGAVYYLGLVQDTMMETQKFILGHISDIYNMIPAVYEHISSVLEAML